ETAIELELTDLHDRITALSIHAAGRIVGSHADDGRKLGPERHIDVEWDSVRKILDRDGAIHQTGIPQCMQHAVDKILPDSDLNPTDTRKRWDGLGLRLRKPKGMRLDGSMRRTDTHHETRIERSFGRMLLEVQLTDRASELERHRRISKLLERNLELHSVEDRAQHIEDIVDRLGDHIEEFAKERSFDDLGVDETSEARAQGAKREDCIHELAEIVLEHRMKGGDAD